VVIVVVLLSTGIDCQLPGLVHLGPSPKCLLEGGEPPGGVALHCFEDGSGTVAEMGSLMSVAVKIIGT
jgi:hypothetical protein